MKKRGLQTKRAALIDEARGLVDNNETLTPEHRTRIDAIAAEAKTLAEDIARADSVEALSGELADSDGTTAARTTVPNLNLKTGVGKDTHERAFLHYMRTGDASANLERRASNATDLNIGTNADGGYLVPTTLYQQIISKRNELSLLGRLNCTKIPGKGTTVQVPYDTQAANVFVSTAEAVAFDVDAPAFGRHNMTLVDYTKRQQLSYQLLRDEDASLMTYLANYVGRAYALTINSLLMAAALADGTAFTMGAAAAATDTDIPGIVYALPDGYEDNAAFVMRRATEGAFRALKGNPFQFLPTPQGSETRLWGYNAYNSAYAEAIATTKKSVVFGNWSFMLYRESPDMTMLRDPYSASSTGQVNFNYYAGLVFKLAQAEAIRVGTHP